jgi:hypothetical protein
MKSILKITVLGLVILFNITACTKEINYHLTIGTNTDAIEERIIAGSFDKIRMEGTINVIVEQGNTIKVMAQDATNLLPLLETRLVNGTLIIAYKDNMSVMKARGLVTITVPSLSDIDMSGTGNFKTLSPFSFNNLTIVKAGTGNASLKGSTQKLTITNLGTGNVNAFELSTEITTVKSSGTGDVEITVSKDLTASLSGTGDVFYKGNPSVKSTITGTGKVKKQ